MLAFLFPGQGSQTPGMLHDLPDHPAIDRTLEEISHSLALDIRELDSAAALESTVAVQLALFSCGIAVARALEAEGVCAEAVAGLSVGSFAAAVHCGVLELAAAARLVRQRAMAMLQLYPDSHGMGAIVGLTERQVAALVQQQNTAQAPVYLANINAPRQIVIAGAVDAIARVLDSALSLGATRAEPLAVSVPSHCPLMDPVSSMLRESLSQATLQPPRIAFIGNVHARVLRSSQAIAGDLANNISHGVRWHDATIVLSELGCNVFLEMAPGHVLTDLARKTLPGIEAIAVGANSFAYAKRFASSAD